MYIIGVVTEHENFIEYEDWYQRIINPIRVELYTQEQPDATAQLADAQVEVEELELDAETRQIASYILYWYEFVINVQGRSQADCQRVYERVLPHFHDQGLTPTSDNQRRRLLTILRCNGCLYGCQELSREELDAMLEDLPHIHQDEYLWHNIAGWAFAHRDTQMLERAYQVLLTQPKHMLGRAKWQRVNIMMRLLTGRANRVDVEQTVRGMEVLPQLLEFRRLIWPVCSEQNLVDDELIAMLDEVQRRILANPPVPGMEPRTRHISV